MSREIDFFEKPNKEKEPTTAEQSASEERSGEKEPLMGIKDFIEKNSKIVLPFSEMDPGLQARVSEHKLLGHLPPFMIKTQVFEFTFIDEEGNIRQVNGSLDSIKELKDTLENFSKNIAPNIKERTGPSYRTKRPEVEKVREKMIEDEFIKLGYTLPVQYGHDKRPYIFWGGLCQDIANYQKRKSDSK